MLILNGFTGHSQSITFNHTYDLDRSPNAGTTILEIEDGYLLAGIGSSQLTDYWGCIVLVKTDSLGNQQWIKCYGASHSTHTMHFSGSFIPVKSGGYAIAGSYYDSIINNVQGLLMRFNSNGDSLWKRTYGTGENEYLNNIVEMPDGGFVMVGMHYDAGNSDPDFWVVRTDSMGNILLDSIYGYGYASSVVANNDNTFSIGMYSKPLHGTLDAAIATLDTSGNILWTKYFGTSRRDPCYGNISRCRNGDFLIWGCLDTVITIGDYPTVEFLARLTPQGDTIWLKIFNNPVNRPIGIYQAKELASGDIIFCGEKGDNNVLSGGWIVLLDSAGNIKWEKIHCYTSDSSNYLGSNLAYDVQLTHDKGFVITGDAFNDLDPGPAYQFNADFWLLKLDSLGNWYSPVSTNGREPDMSNWDIIVYPNPTTGTLHIETPTPTGHIKLYNLLGGEVLARPLTQPHTTLDVSALPPGVFLYRIEAEGKMQSGKVVVE